MAFTNVWDDTFPADTELANLLGANLRQVRLDTQQRMAAISGVSTAMPAFASDAQPSNWNGVLFFATDNGHIYQFNNPSWTDVTTALKIGSPVVYRNTTPTSHTGSGMAIPYSASIAANTLASGSILRFTYCMSIIQGTNNSSISLGNYAFTGGQISLGQVDAHFNGAAAIVKAWLAVTGSTTATLSWEMQNTSNNAIQTGSVSTAIENINTTQVFNMNFYPGQSSDQQVFNLAMVELL